MLLAVIIVYTAVITNITRRTHTPEMQKYKYKSSISQHTASELIDLVLLGVKHTWVQRM